MERSHMEGKLNPNQELFTMESADLALEEANEIEESSDPQVVRDVLERAGEIVAIAEARKAVGDALGVEEEKKKTDLEHQIERLKRILSAQH